MRRFVAAITGIWFAVSAAAAQTPSPSGEGASAADGLSLDQKIKISQLITKEAAPLGSSSFSIAVGGVVPADIPVHSLPAAAETVASQLRGFEYVVVEELVAIVDPRTRKIEIVFPRWGGG